METVKIVINAVDYLDKIKKIPGELYNFLCYDSISLLDKIEIDTL